MTARSLRDDLLAIPGIEDAQIEGDWSAPVGVTVRMASGIDSAEVSRHVRRVLAAHGLRSEMSPPHPEELAAPLRLAEAPPEDERQDEEPVPREVETGGDEPGRRIEVAMLVPSRTALTSIAVAEQRTGMSVVVLAADGSAATRTITGSDGALEARIDEAVVDAVAELLDVAPPRIVEVGVEEVAGSRVATVLLERGGVRLAGSAVVTGTRAYAVGRAAWAALLPV